MKKHSEGVNSEETYRASNKSGERERQIERIGERQRYIDK